ncbi:uncharacterized protein METZ01_LOCUS268825, partial [marine metagenome]
TPTTIVTDYDTIITCSPFSSSLVSPPMQTFGKGGGFV